MTYKSKRLGTLKKELRSVFGALNCAEHKRAESMLEDEESKKCKLNKLRDIEEQYKAKSLEFAYAYIAFEEEEHERSQEC